MTLTAIEVKNSKPETKPYKLFDGNGLYLHVKPAGKYWRLKYSFSDKEKVLALGVYPLVSLLDAREKAYLARKKVADGIDPSHEKKLIKLQQLIRHANNFEAIATEWHENKKGGWTKRHAEYNLKRLKADAFPKIGSRPISEITAPELLLVLRDIEERGALDIAARVRQMCGQIFRYAIATGRAERDISVDLKGALKTRKKSHYANLSEEDLPEFLAILEKYEGDEQTKLALKLLIMTFVRTIELRGAKWSEINFKEAVWKIPAERMKMRVPHIVPLSTHNIRNR